MTSYSRFLFTLFFIGLWYPLRVEYLNSYTSIQTVPIQCLHNILFWYILHTMLHGTMILPFLHNFLWINLPLLLHIHLGIKPSKRKAFTLFFLYSVDDGPTTWVLRTSNDKSTQKLQVQAFCGGYVAIRPHIRFKLFHCSNLFLLSFLLFLRTHHKLRIQSSSLVSTDIFFIRSESCTFVFVISFPIRFKGTSPSSFTFSSSNPSGYCSPGFQKFIELAEQRNDNQQTKIRGASGNKQGK